MQLQGMSDYAFQLDPKVRPQDDFFSWVNDRWIAEHPIPQDERWIDPFLLLSKKVWGEMHELYEELTIAEVSPNSVAQQVRDLYYTGMNFDSFEAIHLEIIHKWFADIDAVKDKRQMSVMLGRLDRIGVGVLWAGYVAPDNENASRHIFHLAQPGLILPDHTYYLEQTELMQKIRRAYQRHTEKVYRQFPRLAPDAGTLWRTVWEIEHALAEKCRSKADLRDVGKNYNRTDFAGLLRSYPEVDWVAYADSLGWEVRGDLSVNQPEYLAFVQSQLDAQPLEAWKVYLKWRFLVAHYGKVSERFARLRFEFFGIVLNGTPDMLPLWERVARSVDAYFGEAAGHLYVSRHFPETAKLQVRDMVEQIRQAFAERIGQLDWMGQPTKAKALQKLEAITVLVGYPDEWHDYATLTIRRSSYLANILELEQFHTGYFLDKLCEPVSRSEWFMSPQTVNAYNDPSRLVICFPAAMLQPPFYDSGASPAANMGGIGTIIAHEFTHGFDDRGCNFDAQGTVRNWQTGAERREFSQRALTLRQHANCFELLPGLFLKGNMVIGESIADLGGIEIAYQALQRKLGCDPNQIACGNLTVAQAFFIQYALTECGHARPEFVREMAATDYHPSERFRVNGILAHTEPFYQAFGVQSGDALYRRPAQRAHIW